MTWKICSCRFVGIAFIPPKIKTIFNHVVLRAKLFTTANQRPLSLLTHPAKTVCEAIFVNKKSQSAKAKDFAVSAQMRREARTRETEGTLVKVQVSWCHVCVSQKGTLFADVNTFLQMWCILLVTRFPQFASKLLFPPVWPTKCAPLAAARTKSP